MLPFSKPVDELAPGTSHKQAQVDLAVWWEVGGDQNESRVLGDAKRGKGAEETNSRLRAFSGSVSGLSVQHCHKATNMALQAAVLWLHHKDEIHYTEGSQRWECIDRGIKAWRGEYAKHGDCSSSLTAWVWSGLDHFHVRDVVNGLRWQAGNTESMLNHGRRVRSLFPGCAVIYNGHTALYTGGGLVVSHGSEAGPLLLPWNYRSDIVSLRSYIV